MESGLTDKTSNWYVLNYIGMSHIHDSARKTVDKFNTSNDKRLELFAPTYVIREEKDGKTVMKTAKLAFHYVFVKGKFAEVKQLCGENNGFSFLINHSSANRYSVIRDEEMRHFKNIARAYQNCLPYFSLDDIDLEDGDIVEVVNGDFPGLIGTYIPKPKSKSGNILLRVYNNVGAIAFNIKASDVRVLEFSKHSTRANDQIDAIIPHLLQALRHFHNDEDIPKPIAAKLTVFCKRMEVVKLPNPKLGAKLQAILSAANRILGNQEAAAIHQAKYEKLKPNVTNPKTLTLLTHLTLT